MPIRKVNQKRARKVNRIADLPLQGKNAIRKANMSDRWVCARHPQLRWPCAVCGTKSKRMKLQPKTLETIIKQIRAALGPDSTGQCYVASEALYHMAAKAQGYKPAYVRLKSPGLTHWYLIHKTGNKNCGYNGGSVRRRYARLCERKMLRISYKATKRPRACPNRGSSFS